MENRIRYAKPFTIFTFLFSFSLFSGICFAQNGEKSGPRYTPAQILRVAAFQPDVEVDTPGSAEEIEKCVVQEQPGTLILKDDTGKTLRVFMSRGGATVNHMGYFRNGIEVYRQFNEKGTRPNEFRWMNNAGTRWGIDEDEDRIIDRWKMISAEEVSQEVISAFVKKDAKIFTRLAPTTEELGVLGLDAQTQSRVQQKTRMMQQGFEKTSAALELTPSTKWVQFSGTVPGLVPSSKDGNSADVLAYENAMVLVRDEKDNSMKQIVLGTIVKIGENNWRLIGLPRLDDPESEMIATDFTFYPPGDVAAMMLNHGPQNTGPAPSEDVMELILHVQKLQSALHETPPEKRAALHEEILTATLKIASSYTTVDEIDIWIRQAANNVDGGVRANEYPDGPRKLEILFTKVKDELQLPHTAAYVKYVQIMSDYYQQLNEKKDPMRVNAAWTETLENFVGEFEKTEGAARAMLELGGYYEMVSQQNEALKWYRKIATDFPGESVIAKKAAGAVRRIESVGKAVPFSAKATNGASIDLAQLKGKIVVLYFWDSWSDSAFGLSRDLKTIADKNKNIQFIGINVDDSTENMKAHLAANPVPFPQIHEPGDMDRPGGIESPSALYWGLQIPPMMILYDAEGKVVEQNITTANKLLSAIEELEK